jgi:hypothetical protein
LQSVVQLFAIMVDNVQEQVEGDNSDRAAHVLSNQQVSPDERYVQLMTTALDTCRTYKPRFGKGVGSGLTLSEFKALYGTDPFYHWIGLDSPLMYAAHKAAGGITSVYRQVGIGCQRIFHQMLQDYLGLSPEEAAWSYVVGSRKLSLDGRIETDDVKKPEVKERIREWMEGAGRIANLPEHTLQHNIKGCVFEIRQGYKSKDSKRQNADIANAANAYVHGYIPVMMLFSTQIDGDLMRRYKEHHWVVLIGKTTGSATESSYAFCRDVIGYDLARFFENYSPRIKSHIESILKTLLSPQ